MKSLLITIVNFIIIAQQLIRFSVWQVLEKKWECNGAVHQLFIDFKKDYDSVK
jgi:hypothetical protein